MDVLERMGVLGLLLFGIVFLATMFGWSIITLWMVSPLIVIALAGIALILWLCRSKF